MERSGTSFGGFCVTRYLSASPDGLAEAFLTGGLPPLGSPGRHLPATYRRVLDRNRSYYERYPEDRERVRNVVGRLDAEEVRLPSGDRLTSCRFRALGNMLGMSDGFERLHYIVGLPVGSPAFVHDVEGMATLAFGRNPIYAVLHEACYGQGYATKWSAERTLLHDFREDPTLFTGEHIYPWMFEDFGALRPLRDAAHLLAEHVWPELYDVRRLGKTTRAGGRGRLCERPLRRARVFRGGGRGDSRAPHVGHERVRATTRADGSRVLGRLIDLVRGDV